MGRMLCLAAALGAAGCGQVAKAPADAAPDASPPDALTCSAVELACGSTCIDPLTTHDHCGSCDTACTDAEDCLAGHCTDTTASCFAVHQFHPDTPSGPITHKLDGAKFFCDFATGLQYDELSYGQYDVGHAGFTLIGLADFQNPTLQQAFIFLYNKQQGIDLITQWSETNCCFKLDTVVNTSNMMGLAGGVVFPASAVDAQRCGGLHTDNPGHFQITASNTFSMNNLTSTFFTTNPVAALATCSNGSNPAFFWRRH